MKGIALLAIVSSVALVGCGGTNSLPPETDAAQGREILKTVLDAWVSGKSMDDMKNGSPSIIARDPDWKAGHKLVSYEIDTTDERSGVDLAVPVKLMVSKAGGPPQEKKVKFNVGIGSQTICKRQE